MKYETKREIGAYGERLAARYLFFHGHRIREKNYRAGNYEIDLISETRSDVVFTEVKTRTYENHAEAETLPPPRHAVNSDKQRFTRQAALAYLRSHRSHKQPRMDVIEVLLEKRADGKRPHLITIRHIKAAY